MRDALERAPPLNIFRMMANAETAFRPWLRWGATLLSDLELDPLLRELAILRVAASRRMPSTSGCSTRASRRPSARRTSRSRRSSATTSSAAASRTLERLVLRFTTEVVRDARASDEALERLTEASRRAR